jgi:predicted nicotinamide N-methyase
MSETPPPEPAGRVDAALLGVAPSSTTVVVGRDELELAVLDGELLLDALIESGEEDFDRRNPYFGQVWPTAIAMSELLLERGRLDGVAVLDLGCGPGLVGIVAARLGARVTFADVVEGALVLARRNAETSGVTGTFVRFDLREPLPLARFALVVASDLLYEPWLPAALSTALPALLAPGGHALVGDPMRRPGDLFADAAEDAGLAVAELARRAEGPAGPQRIRIFELTAW